MRSTLLGCVLFTFSCGTPTAFTSLVVGDNLSCVVAGNRTQCWGDGESMPQQRLFGSEVVELRLGSETHCALLATPGWSCWGSNAQGQFGVATPATSLEPTPIVFTGDSLKLARFGGEFSCGTTMGELACWGAADRGQLGPSVTTNTFFATPISLPDDVREFALGRDHACAVTATMGVWCWGAGTEGQLGNLDSRDSAFPVRVPLDDAFVAESSNVDNTVSLALGETHSCAQAGPEIRCWGGDEFGQLGQPNRNSALGIYTVEAQGTLQAGANHTCALSPIIDDMDDMGGVAQCWGDNDKSQLQSPAESPRGPVTVGVAPITSIGLGIEHSCALSEGQVLCWGSATQGQLGAATSLDTFVPTMVSGLQ